MQIIKPNCYFFESYRKDIHAKLHLLVAVSMKGYDVDLFSYHEPNPPYPKHIIIQVPIIKLQDQDKEVIELRSRIYYFEPPCLSPYSVIEIVVGNNAEIDVNCKEKARILIERKMELTSIKHIPI